MIGPAASFSASVFFFFFLGGAFNVLKFARKRFFLFITTKLRHIEKSVVDRMCMNQIEYAWIQKKSKTANQEAA